MTIAIGLLCGNGDNILLAADGLISYKDFSSNKAGGKLYKSKHEICVAVADSVSWSHIVVSEFLERIDLLDPADSAYRDKVKMELQKACNYAFRWWREDILKTVNLTLDEYLHDEELSQSKREEADNVLAVAKSEGLPVEMIVVGFGKKHSIFFHMNGLTIREESSPGNFLAGSGASAATDWLNYRGQNVHMPWEVSYYHLLEALHFSELSRPVGSDKYILYLGAHDEYVMPLFSQPDTKGGDLVQRLIREHWVKKTEFSDELRQEICETHGVQFKPLTFKF
jgi:hypothetical protein